MRKYKLFLASAVACLCFSIGCNYHPESHSFAGHKSTALRATQPPIESTETPSTPSGQADESQPATPSRFQAVVVEILDGDTIRTKSPDGTISTIRLDGVDAPEKAQPFSNVSANALGALVFQKLIDIEATGPNRYQRVLARVSIEGRSVNSDLVSNGMAWHYVKYAASDTALAQAEQNARQLRLGLGKDPKPVSPWDWRNGVRPEAGSMASGNPNPNADAEVKTVYITATGSRYLRKGCRHLRDSAISIPLS